MPNVDPYNFTWEQGEDFTFQLIYKTGTIGAETPVNLTGYSLRMDIYGTPTGRIYTFNSVDIADLDGPGAGIEGDTNKEAVLGTDGTINISIPRSLTLPGGAIYTELVAGRNVFQYDIFLRDNGTPAKQMKILNGTITVNKSVTLWV